MRRALRRFIHGTWFVPVAFAVFIAGCILVELTM